MENEFIDRNKKFFDKHPDLMLLNIPVLNKYQQKDIDGNFVEYWEIKDGILVDKTVEKVKEQKIEKLRAELEELNKREKRKEAKNES